MKIMSIPNMRRIATTTIPRITVMPTTTSALPMSMSWPMQRFRYSP